MDSKENSSEVKENLRAGFNIFPEEQDYAWRASTRVEHTREWVPRLLRWSLILNVLAACLYIAAFLVMINKPSPVIYSSTERGSIFKMEKLK